MAGAVENLLAAGGARSGDVGRDAVRHRGQSLAYGGEEEHFADGQRCLVVLFLVAEGAGHTAAGRGYDM